MAPNRPDPLGGLPVNDPKKLVDSLQGTTSEHVLLVYRALEVAGHSEAVNAVRRAYRQQLDIAQRTTSPLEFIEGGSSGF